jgi:hypothetical protein
VNLTSTARRALTGAALAVLVLGGCSSTDSGTSGDTATASPSAAESSPASAPPSSPAGSSPSASPSVSAGTPTSSPPTARTVEPCITADLRVSLSPGEGAAGSTYYSLRLANVSDHPCRTGGFGGVSLVETPQGAPIGAPADRVKKSQARPVLLKPGGRAEATLQETNAENYSKDKCRPTRAKGLRVYPPNETRSAYVRHATTACRSAGVHLLSLSPYRAAG